MHDTLRTGTFASIPNALSKPHPLYESLTDLHSESLARRKASTVSFGMHMAVRTKFEDAIALEVQRLPTCAIPSSMVARSIVSGTDDSLDFSDVLNLPQDAPFAKLSWNL